MDYCVADKEKIILAVRDIPSDEKTARCLELKALSPFDAKQWVRGINRAGRKVDPSRPRSTSGSDSSEDDHSAVEISSGDEDHFSDSPKEDKKRQVAAPQTGASSTNDLFTPQVCLVLFILVGLSVRMGPVECAFVVGSIGTCYIWQKWSDRGSGTANPKQRESRPRSSSQQNGEGTEANDALLERASDLDDDDLENERSSAPAATGAQLSRVGPRWVDLRVPLPITAEEYLVGLRANSHRVYKEESEHLVIKEHVLQDVCNSFKIFHTMPMKKLPRFLRPLVPDLEAKSQIRLNFPQTQSYTRILKPKSLSEFFHYTEAWIVKDITDTPLFELAPNPSDSHEVLHLDVCKDGWKKYKAEHDPALHKFGGIGPLGEGWQKTKVKCGNVSLFFFF
jgi:hypothetical protein